MSWFIIGYICIVLIVAGLIVYAGERAPYEDE
jgi:hypothetical protein